MKRALGWMTSLGYLERMTGFTAPALAPNVFVRLRAPVLAILTLAILGATGPAWPQAGKQPPPGPNTPAQPPATQAAPDQTTPQPGEEVPPAQKENPGLINELGKLIDNPSSIFPSFPSLKSPKETIDDWNARARDAAKDASEGLSRLTTPLSAPSIVKGRVACPVAANGAPDCKAASDKLCQTKGFKEGKSLDTDSAQACSMAGLLTGGNREPGNCRTENYVTRALCQ
jgi:hypothetical protein